MSLSLIPFLTIIVLFFFYQLLNKHYFGVVSLLFITYIGMFFASFVLLLSEKYQGVFPYSFEAMVFFAVCLIIMFIGFMGFKDRKIQAIRIENMLFFRLLEICLIIGGFSAILFYLPFAINGLKGDVAANREFMKAAQAQVLGRFGLVNSILSLFSKLFIVAQICAFINLIPLDRTRHVKRAVLLMFSSLSYVVQVLSYVGRDGPIFWLMTFIFCLLFFKNFLPAHHRRRIKKWGVIIGLILLVPFFQITVSRFGEDAIWSLINYYGQQPHNFNDQYLVNAPIRYGRANFPVFVGFFDKIGLGFAPPHEKEYYFSYYLSSGVAPWVFGTYINDFIQDTGKLVTLAILVFLAVLARVSTRRSTKTGILDFSNLIVFSLLYQISYWGVFYFRHYSTNWYIIFMLLLALFFKISKYPGQCSYFSRPNHS